MGKIFNGLSAEIMSAMKEKNNEKSNALKNLKAKMLEWKTSKEGAKVVNSNNGEIPDAQELVIIKKYVTELMGDAEIYKTAKPEMAKAAEVEASYLTPYLPAEASEADIRKCVETWMKNQSVTSVEQKQMGIVIKFVKGELENADGKLVSDIVRSYIK